MMGLGREETLEILAPPRFQPCAKVRAIKYIKNDGTYPNRDVGDILVHKGDVGYVRD
ncbi:MAG: nitrogen fixation protein NifZ, partial [Rhodoplanes sp.]